MRSRDGSIHTNVDPTLLWPYNINVFKDENGTQVFVLLNTWYSTYGTVHRALCHYVMELCQVSIQLQSN
jgi:hypothetical protein